MKLVVGLGNPGLKYAWTRHNVGWLMIDSIVSRLSLSSPQMKFRGEFWGGARYAGERVSFLKPHTFMNLSGLSVHEAMNYQNIEADDLLVIYDDVALPFGKIRMREKGSAGGHNGIASIIAQAGSLNVQRLRIGVGSPEHGEDMAQWVLGDFPSQQKKMWDKLEDIVWDAFDAWMNNDIQRAMNKVNTLSF